MGNIKKAAISHLHAEAGILQVNDHLRMLCLQFYANTLQPSHPSHPVVTLPLSPRNMKHTLPSLFQQDIAPFLINGVVPPESYKLTIKAIHTESVCRAISKVDTSPTLNHGCNCLLGTILPPVDPSEKSLARQHRSCLSQLRSGFCTLLRSYLHVVGRSASDSCPECDGPP